MTGIDAAFEDQFSIGRHHQVDRPGRHDIDRPAQQAAGAVEFVVAHAEIKTGGELDGGMGADHDGDLQRPAGFRRAAREQSEVVIGRDADHGGAAVEDGEAGEGGVAAAGRRIARQDHAGGEVGAAFAFEEARHRQCGQRRIERDDLLDAATGDLHRFYR